MNEARQVEVISCIITGDRENAKCNKATSIDFEEMESSIQSYDDSICFPMLSEGYISNFFNAFDAHGFFVAFKPTLSRRVASSSNIYMYFAANDNYYHQDYARQRSAYVLGFGIHA